MRLKPILAEPRAYVAALFSQSAESRRMSPLLPHHRITGPVTFHTPASPVASTSPQLTILPITRIRQRVFNIPQHY